MPVVDMDDPIPPIGFITVTKWTSRVPLPGHEPPPEEPYYIRASTIVAIHKSGKSSILNLEASFGEIHVEESQAEIAARIDKAVRRERKL